VAIRSRCAASVPHGKLMDAKTRSDIRQGYIEAAAMIL